MKTLKLLFILTSLLMNISILNATTDKGVAKVMKKRGTVILTQTKKKLKKGDWIPEGSQITTKSRSFVKLLFMDKSKLTLGANSQMEVTQFPKKKAGIINLIRGQLRSKVSKNYLQIDKNKSKLFIKTKTAAMGVRGTDFQVNYNPNNQNTTLITFEGAVAMGSLTKFKRMRNALQDRLEKVVSSPTSVMVKRGQLSGVMPAIDSKPIAPVKLNRKQLKALESNDGSKVSDAGAKKNTKPMVRSIIPPGVDSGKFAASTNVEIAGQMAKVDQSVTGKNKVAFNDSTKQETVEKKGSLKDGGYVDTKNALYIPPPENAPIDPMTNEVIVPVQLGSFDKATGDYVNDYFEVDEEGNFTAKVDDSLDGRTPASTTNTMTDVTVTNVYDVMDEQLEDIYTIPADSPELAGATDADSSKIMDETIADRDQAIEDSKTTTSGSNRAVIRIILDKQ